MLGYRKAKIAKAAAAHAIARAREAVVLGREALRLYESARRSEEALLDIVEGAAATGDVEHIQTTVSQLREEHDRYRAREDAADVAHRLGWSSL